MRRISVLGFGILGLALIGCRSSSGGGTGDDDTTVDAPAKQTIQDVQNDAMPVGTPVALDGVIVTAIDAFGASTGDFWIEEPGGGPFSGVHVFHATASDVAALKVGDIISVAGAVKDEFALPTDTTGRTVTEIEPVKGGTMTITKTGNGTVPAPAAVDALMIGQLATQAERDAQWEMWEGVLIKLTNVTAFGAPKCVGTACNDMTLQNFSITGVAKAESSIAPFPTIASGDCLASMTGVVDYFFDYLVLPTATTDVVTGGAACAPHEDASQGVTACTDGKDNDGNGFADCMDLNCEVGAHAFLGASCTPSDTTCGCSANLPVGTSVNKVNTGATGAVLMNNVFVTAVGTNGYWAADSATATQNGGVFIFTSSAPTGVTVGQNLATVQGLVSPFNGSKTGGTLVDMEIGNATAGAVLSSGNALTPVTSATATTLADATAGGPFAGSLVQLTFMKVKVVGNSFNQVVLVDNSNKTISIDDGAFAFYGGTKAAPNLPALGTCFSTITGVMDADTFDPQVRTLNPRSATDMVVAASGCTGN